MLAVRRNVPTSGPQPMDHNDRIGRSIPMLGGPNPFLAQKRLMTQGRYLSGIGNDDCDADTRYGDSLTRSMEDTDDVTGSGIFDSAGRVTVHEEAGVFEDHPSMPNYIEKQRPFVPNTAVDDYWGAQVVEIPGGGLLFVDQNANTGLMAGSNSPHTTVRDANDPPSLPLGHGMPPFVMWPPDSYSRQSAVRAMQTQRMPPGVRQQMLSSMGADPDPVTTAPSVGWGTYAAAGLIVGASVAMVYGAVTMKPGRRR